MSETVRTENGAVMHKTSGKALVDFFFKVPSLRTGSFDEVLADLCNAYAEDPSTFIALMFYIRDIRGSGLGERNIFLHAFRYIAERHINLAKKLADEIPEYGCWRDVVRLYAVFSDGANDSLANYMAKMMQKQLNADVAEIAKKKPKSISLLAKWLPSDNTSSRATRQIAHRLMRDWHMTKSEYRSTLVKIRKHLRVVECQMSDGEWDEIDYNAVPSNANARYKDAFLRHDTERRKEYLSSVKKGEAKINASALYPYEVVAKYRHGHGCGIDDALELMWKNLKDIEMTRPCIVVADGSGSMGCHISNEVTAHDVADSLAIYCSERLPGDYKNKYITFSSRPQYVDFGRCDNLWDKLIIAQKHDECANTNIEAVFDLILKTAIQSHATEIPDILVISDMEFDDATDSRRMWYGNDVGFARADETLFQKIAKRYAEVGVKMPRLSFWNVNSRTNGIPVREGPGGTALLSGYSPNVLKLALSGEATPYGVLLEALKDERYDRIRKIAARYIKSPK